MGDSGRRKERIKIPLIGWEGKDYRKDVRSKGPIGKEIPKLEQVKFPRLFLRDGLRTVASGRSQGLRPGKLPVGFINPGYTNAGLGYFQPVPSKLAFFDPSIRRALAEHESAIRLYRDQSRR